MEVTTLKKEVDVLSLVVEDPVKFYQVVINRSDPRVADWMWMQSPLPTLLILVLYWSFVYFGPRFMEKRPAFTLKPVLFVFNSSIVALTVWMTYEMLAGMYEADYGLFCTPMRYSYEPAQMRIASALWWYYFSKFLEFFDTVFFILRKKNNQVTFLHVYHHSSMFFLWWIGIKWVAGGQSVLGALINCAVHIVMYSYYALSSLGPAMQKYLWWKKHITHLQLLQFTAAFIHCSHSLYIDCNFPKWMHYTLLGYSTSFIILFTNFYIHAYIKKKAPSPAGKARSDKQHFSSPVSNGTLLQGPNGISDAKKKED